MQHRNRAVSVVIPTFDRPALLGEAIESVLAQDFTDFDVTVIDAGPRIVFTNSVSQSLE